MRPHLHGPTPHAYVGTRGQVRADEDGPPAVTSTGNDPVPSLPPARAQAIGGMRGIPAMLWETSLLDPEEGIRFRRARQA